MNTVSYDNIIVAYLLDTYLFEHVKLLWHFESAHAVSGLTFTPRGAASHFAEAFVVPLPAKRTVFGRCLSQGSFSIRNLRKGQERF